MRYWEPGKGVCSSLGSLQRLIKLALNRHTGFAWREGEGKKSIEPRLEVEVSMSGEGGLGNGAHRVEGLTDKVGRGG